MARARASATRCCCPPDSCHGNRSPRPSRWIRLEQLRDAPIDVRLWPLSDLESETDVARDVHVREQRIGLEDHADVALVRGLVSDILSVDGDAARGRAFEARDHAQRRRLAAARWAQERDELTTFRGQLEILHGRHVTEPLLDAA